MPNQKRSDYLLVDWVQVLTGKKYEIIGITNYRYRIIFYSKKL